MSDPAPKADAPKADAAKKTGTSPVVMILLISVLLMIGIGSSFNQFLGNLLQILKNNLSFFLVAAVLFAIFRANKK